MKETILAFLMQREKMAGVNLREENKEVISELLS